jgi:hypothetical protein
MSDELGLAKLVAQSWIWRALITYLLAQQARESDDPRAYLKQLSEQMLAHVSDMPAVGSKEQLMEILNAEIDQIMSGALVMAEREDE